MPSLRRPWLLRALVAFLLGGVLSLTASAQQVANTMSGAEITVELNRLRAGPPAAPNGEEDIARTQRALDLLGEQARRGTPSDRNEIARLHQHLGYALIMRRYGDRADNVEGSIRESEMARALYAPHSNPWGRTQLNLGFAYLQRESGRDDALEKAIIALEAALATPEIAASPGDRAGAHDNLGTAYGYRIRGDITDNLRRAVAAHELAMLTFGSIGDTLGVARAGANAGLAYLSLAGPAHEENVEKGIALLSRAEAIFLSAGDPVAAAHARGNLGIAYFLRLRGDREDNLDRAIEAYGSAADDFRLRREMVFWATEQEHLGAAYMERRRGGRAANIERAIAAFRSALAVAAIHDNAGVSGNLNNNLGYVLQQRTAGDSAENLAASRDALHAALSVRAAAHDPWGRVQTLRNLALTEGLRGDWRAALGAVDEALGIGDEMSGAVVNPGELDAVAGALNALGPMGAYAAWRLGDIDGAWTRLERGRARSLRATLALDAARLPASTRTRLAQMRARVSELERLEATQIGAEHLATVEQLRTLRRQTAALLQPVSGNGATTAALLAGALERVDIVVAPIATASGGVVLTARRNGGQVVSTAVAAPQLTSARLATILSGDTPSGLAGWLQRYRSGSQRDATEPARIAWMNAIAATNQTLASTLSGPMQQALQAANAQPDARVLLLLPGDLALLPIGLLEGAAPGKPLLETYALRQSPSLVAFARARSGAAAGLAAVANPTGNLAAAPAEAAIAASWLGETRPALQGNATREATLRSLAGASYWHFATHAYYDWRDPHASGLLLAGRERLTVEDIANAGPLGQPRLVFLSACETGLSYHHDRPDEFVGLPVAFIEAGAQSVVASLWPISDAGSALLVMKFYEIYASQDRSAPEALRQAQLWLRDTTPGQFREYLDRLQREGRLSASDAAPVAAELTGYTPTEHPFAHPWYWAAFVAIGD